MTLIAGIDSSTQNCKVVICDAATGTIVRMGRAAHPVGTEVDPEAWWEALRTAISDAGGIDDISAVSIGGQQHGMVALDAAGAVIRDALLWNDTRSAAAAADLIAEFGADEFAGATGSVPVASFTATKLRWMRDNEPDNAARVAAVALPHDWLTWRLRGFGPGAPLGARLDELTTDRSDASGTGYFDAVANRWRADILDLALRRGDGPVGNSGDQASVHLPRVVAPGEASGTTAAFPEFPTPDGSWAAIPAGIVVAAGAGDNAAAAFGLGAVAGDIVVSIGTSGTVFAVTDTPTNDASGVVAGFADASGRHLPLVATLNAARVLDGIARLLGIDHDELGRLALEAHPGADGLVLQPYFEGERTPNRPDATATLFGMTLFSTSRKNLARAAIEGLLCGLADGLDAVTALGVEVQRILLIGGAAQNLAVQTIAAQVFAAPVVIPEPAEYVALGAARQAAWALADELVEWPVATSASPPVDTRQIIRDQYSARR